MATGALYIYLECRCGHRAQSWLEDWPEDLRDGRHLKMTTFARLKCSACGRVGRPIATICGWDHKGKRDDPAAGEAAAGGVGEVGKDHLI